MAAHTRVRPGNIVWSHNLIREFNGTKLPFGYSSHVLPYKGKLVTLVGGRVGVIGRVTGARASAAIAFNQTDGSVAWKGLEFENAHSTPLVMDSRSVCRFGDRITS